jgi:DNA repair protein RadC
MAQEDNKEQLGFFQDTTPTATPKKEKCTAIPIYRVSLVRESRLHCYHKQIRSSADAGALLHAYLEGVDREHFVVLLLDQKNKVIGINNVSIGSLTASVVHPREVFKPAILSNAAAIILAHNHPSGQPQPSQEDRVLTVRLVTAGKLLGISVLDHVIIGDGTSAYFSFADEGLLQ